MRDPDLLAELDEASVAAGEVCWCGRHPEECDEAGGCAFTREIAAVAAARDEEIAYLTGQLRAAGEALARARPSGHVPGGPPGTDVRPAGPIA
jgi:hypothetical protein